MNTWYSIKDIKKVIWLFVAMFFYKIATELGYCYLTIQDPETYFFAFSPIKYAIGLIWCIVLFFSIRHNNGKASAFLLYLTLLLQIIPISVIYAFADDSSEYFNILCIAFLLCSLLVGYMGNGRDIKRNAVISKMMMIAFGFIAAGLIIVVILKYGMPSLQALDIYSVYEIRRSGAFNLGKYLNYLFTWTTSAILPIVIAISLSKKKYFLSIISCGAMLLLYLYSGHKTFLFAIPFLVIITPWAKRNNFYQEVFMVACFAFFALVLLMLVSPIMQGLFEKIYSLLGRRSIIVPANNKFKYFDYFSSRPKMGLGGIFPRWLLYIPNYYEEIPYSFEISAIYYGKPDMNSNTGFLAEGYMRFGHIGTFIILLIFAWILKLIDKLQERTSYQLAVSTFSYPVFGLTDAHLLDSFVLGRWMILLLFLLFYCNTPVDKSKKKVG